MPDLEVVVSPRASSDRVGPYVDGMLRVRVTRPPADGEANRAVLRLVADALGIPPGRLALVAGVRSRRKRVRVRGVEPSDLERLLAPFAVD